MRGPGRKRLQVEGLLGPATQSWEPIRVVGTEQRGGPEDPPEHCPNCSMGAPHWQRGYWASLCVCGARWVRTTGAMILKRRPPPEPGGRA